MTTPNVTELPRNAQPGPAFEQLSRAEKKARLVQVLDRGLVHDRLHVPLPTDKHGEWVRNDPLEIARMKTMGFDIDVEHASKRNLHSDGTSGNVVGDVIFMTCGKEQKEILDEIALERAERIHNPRRAKEESEFINAADPEIHAFTESKTRSVSGKDALQQAINSQVTPLK
jgi:hypothetical protein